TPPQFPIPLEISSGLADTLPMATLFRLLGLILVAFPAVLQAEHEAPIRATQRATAGPRPLKCATDVAQLKEAGFVIPVCPETEGAAFLTADFPASAIFVKAHNPGQYLDVLDMIRALSTAKMPLAINVM